MLIFVESLIHRFTKNTDRNQKSTSKSFFSQLTITFFRRKCSLVFSNKAHRLRRERERKERIELFTDKRCKSNLTLSLTKQAQKYDLLIHGNSSY